MSDLSNGPRMTMPSSSETNGPTLRGSDPLHPAGAAMTGVGGAMSGLAESLREHSPPAISAYTERAAMGLEQAGAYLQQGSIGEAVEDLSDIVRRHPLPAVLAGAALGFLFARQLRR